MGVEPGTAAKRWSRQLGRLAPLPLGQGHLKRKERESNPQGSSLGRFRGGCHHPLACPSVQTGCGGRNRTCDVTLNRRPPVPTQAPPQSKSGRRDLNPRSRSRDHARVVPGGIPGFPTSCSPERQRESNPHFRHGKAAGCRYIMGASWCAELSNNRSTGRDSNPRRRITGAVSSPLDDQCITSVGPEGLEPSPGGLRVRCAAANTLIPFFCFLCAAVGAEGVEPSV